LLGQNRSFQGVFAPHDPDRVVIDLDHVDKGLQAEAQYRSTVMTACQNVADALRSLQSDADALKAATLAERTAKASLDIVQSQLNADQVNQLAVLNAQQTCLVAAVTRVQAEANRLADTAALFMALGGGWPADCAGSDWRKCAMGEVAASSSVQTITVR